MFQFNRGYDALRPLNDLRPNGCLYISYSKTSYISNMEVFLCPSLSMSYIYLYKYLENTNLFRIFGYKQKDKGYANKTI